MFFILKHTLRNSTKIFKNEHNLDKIGHCYLHNMLLLLIQSIRAYSFRGLIQNFRGVFRPFHMRVPLRARSLYVLRVVMKRPIQKIKVLLPFAQVLVKTANAIISSSCFAEDGTELFDQSNLLVCGVVQLYHCCRRC